VTVAALGLVLTAMVIIGLLMDFSYLSIQGARLDTATEAAANAALRACLVDGGLDGPCAEQVAAQYLQANFPDATLEAAFVDGPRVEVHGSAQGRRVFGAVLGAAPLRIHAAYAETAR
jgi:Flp pilus assembly protein TadG